MSHTVGELPRLGSSDCKISRTFGGKRVREAQVRLWAVAAGAGRPRPVAAEDEVRRGRIERLADGAPAAEEEIRPLFLFPSPIVDVAVERLAVEAVRRLAEAAVPEDARLEPGLAVLQELHRAILLAERGRRRGVPGDEGPDPLSEESGHGTGQGRGRLRFEERPRCRR